ncbi:hypothetical protein BTN50_2003 [Candidatus Enterovibrio altilux]|uniref:Uncharacterized protein n=1 Tax=Candidatus Enterovibrio altilux TaxID=1927128 RepID=A0A291BBM2_9GAMM|nr:hypothetical protein BTN50_2003 [Candidatus Enterovibrio luxaltus]
MAPISIEKRDMATINVPYQKRQYFESKITVRDIEPKRL